MSSYQDFDSDEVRGLLCQIGTNSFETMQMLKALQAEGTAEEQVQMRDYLGLLDDPVLNVVLATVVSFGRVDIEGFGSEYSSRSDLVVDVITALAAKITALYPDAVKTIQEDGDQDLTIELAICQQAACAISNICRLADLDENLENTDIEMVAKLRPIIEPLNALVVNSAVGESGSSDPEVYGVMQSLIYRLGIEPVG